MLDVLVAGPRTLERTGLIRLLEESGQVRVSGTADLGDPMVVSAAEKGPDVLLVLLPAFQDLPAGSIRQVRDRAPETGVLLVSPRTDRQAVIQMINAGADGHVTIRTDTGELLEAICKVGGGDRYLCPCCRDQIVDKALTAPQGMYWPEPHDQLTTREREVLELVRAGQTACEVADQLGISTRTAERHIRSAREKLGLTNYTELIHYLLAKGRDI